MVSPSFRATRPGWPAAVSCSFAIAALDSWPSGPSSHSTLRAFRPWRAVQKLSATTATPLVTWTTCLTPGIAFAAVASNDFTLPPATTGHFSMDPTSMPGTFTSIP